METTHGWSRFHLHLLPQTREGWSAVWCFLAFAGLAVVSGTIANTAGGSPWMALLTIPFLATVIGSGVYLFIAVVRRGDRGAVLFLPLFLVLFALMFVVGEVAFPH